MQGNKPQNYNINIKQPYQNNPIGLINENIIYNSIFDQHIPAIAHYGRQAMQGLPNLPAPLQVQQIVSVFKSKGYPQQSMITQKQLTKILNQRYRISTNKLPKQQIINQIWMQSEATTKGEISIQTITSIILEAQKILIQRIQKLTTNKYGPPLISTLQAQLKEKKQQLQVYLHYLDNSIRPKMNQLSKEYMNQELLLKQYKTDLDTFIEDYQTINQMFRGQNFYEKSFHHNFDNGYSKVNSQYIDVKNLHYSQLGLAHSYSKMPKAVTQYMKKQKSNRLLFLFHLLNLLTFAEFFIMSSVRISMVPLTTYLHSYYFIFYGFKNDYSIYYLILHILVSILGDIIFIIFTIQGKFLLMPFGFTNNIYKLYGTILFIVLIISVVIRMACPILLLSFRNAHKNSTIFYFQLMGYFLPQHSNYVQIIQPQNLIQTSKTIVKQKPVQRSKINNFVQNNQAGQKAAENNMGLLNNIDERTLKGSNEISRVVPYQNIQKLGAESLTQNNDNKNFMLPANQSGKDEYLYQTPNQTPTQINVDYPVDSSDLSYNQQRHQGIMRLQD